MHGPDALPGADDLGRRHAPGRRMVGTSVFTLARLDPLDGRPATTHWSLVGRFRSEFPDIDLRPEALYVDDGTVLTAAGGAAVLDLCLHIVASFLGAAEADRFEQILFLGTRCSGHLWRPTGRRGSAENVDARIGELLSWVVNNLHLDLSVDELSCRAFMSRRSLTRHFRAATGTTPYAWILEQRIQVARKLLAEHSDLTVEDIAGRVGFGNAGALRQHFLRSVGCTLKRYREAIRTWGVRARTSTTSPVACRRPSNLRPLRRPKLRPPVGAA